VVREALAAGRPIVASDGAGVRELLAGRASALLVPPGVAALAAALARLCASPALLAAMATAGDAEPLWERVGPQLAGGLLGPGFAPPSAGASGAAAGAQRVTH